MNLVSKKNFKWYITAVVLFSVVLFAMCVYMVSWIPLTIRSPYSGYELGYQKVILSADKLCSSEMADKTGVTLESPLISNTELYDYDETTKEVVAKDSKYHILPCGKYKVKVLLKGQESKVTLSVFDTIAPQIWSDYTKVPLVVKTTRDIPKYVVVKDYSEKIHITYYPDTKKHLVYIMATDESSNTTKTVWRYEVNLEGEVTQKSDRDEKSPVITSEEVKSLEDFEQIERENEKKRAEIVKEEESLQKELLKGNYEAMKKQMDTYHEGIERQTYVAESVEEESGKSVIVKAKDAEDNNETIHNSSDGNEPPIMNKHNSEGSRPQEISSSEQSGDSKNESKDGHTVTEKKKNTSSSKETTSIPAPPECDEGWYPTEEQARDALRGRVPSGATTVIRSKEGESLTEYRCYIISLSREDTKWFKSRLLESLRDNQPLASYTPSYMEYTDFREESSQFQDYITESLQEGGALYVEENGKTTSQYEKIVFATDGICVVW